MRERGRDSLDYRLGSPTSDSKTAREPFAFALSPHL